MPPVRFAPSSASSAQCAPLLRRDLHCLRNVIHSNLMCAYILADFTWILNYSIQVSRPFGLCKHALDVRPLLSAHWVERPWPSRLGPEDEGRRGREPDQRHPAIRERSGPGLHRGRGLRASSELLLRTHAWRWNSSRQRAYELFSHSLAADPPPPQEGRRRRTHRHTHRRTHANSYAQPRERWLALWCGRALT